METVGLQQGSTRDTRADDEHWMQLALAQAALAAAQGEVPVGAVVVDAQGHVLATGHNQPIAQHDPTGHAEVVALRAAARALGNYRLEGCTLYVTLEPCAMCSGAMLHARLARVVFGAADARTGAAGSVLNLFALPALNHQTQVQGGVLAPACAQLLKGFFAPRRANPQPLREDALRTPESRFAHLPPLPGVRHWVSDWPVLAGLRLHYLEQAPPGPPRDMAVLCLHTAEGWSWDHRHLWTALAGQGLRVVAPDLIGFGHSDKPKKERAHTLAWHTQVLQALQQHLGVRRVLLLAPARRGMAALAAAWWRTCAPGCAAVLTWSTPAEEVQRSAVRTGARPTQRQRRAASHHPAYDAPFPDSGHRAAPRAFARFEPVDFTAPPMNALPGLTMAHCPSADLDTDTGGQALARAVVQLLQSAGWQP